MFLLSQLSPFAIVSFSHIQHLFHIYSYYFVDMYTQMNRCSAHKIDNCSWLFHLSPFAILDCFYFKISICKFKTLCGILIILSSIASYLPWHIFIELHSYTLRYVHLGEWACPVGEWACPVQEKQLLLCLLTFHESLIPSYIYIYIMMNCN